MSVKRINNRKANQLRPIKVTKNYIIHPEGSVLIACGNTKVICNASIEERVPPFLRDTGSGWVTAEYSMLPHSTHTRMRREVKKGKESGRTQEISRLIGRSLRSIVDFEKLGERQITIDCDVIQADGGTRCASITGGYIALALAVQKLLKAKIITKNPITDSVSAISVGIFKGKPLLDLNYEEDSNAEVDMNFVITGKGKFVEVQGTAEEEPFSFEELVAMKDLALKGARALKKIQKEILK
jgi:ribonuclease PH